MMSGDTDAVASHREGRSDPPRHHLSYLSISQCENHLAAETELGVGCVKLGHFVWLPQEESSRKKRGLIILSEFFFCLIFPSWQGRFQLWIEKKFMLSRAVLVLVTTHAACFTAPSSLPTRSGGENNRQDTFPSPECKEQSQIGSFLDESSFQTWNKRSRGSDYLLWTSCMRNLRSSGQPAYSIARKSKTKNVLQLPRNGTVFKDQGHSRVQGC